MVLGFVCIRDGLSTFRPLLCPREDRVSCRSHLSSILKPVGVLPDLFGRPCHVPWTHQWGVECDSVPLSQFMHSLGPKALGHAQTRFVRSDIPQSALGMCRKRRHASDNEKEQTSSPLKRSKYHSNVTPTAFARRRAEKPKYDLLIGLRCFICTSTSDEGLLPLDEQPKNLVPRCHQNGGIWMAHRICAQLLNGVCIFKPSNSEELVVEGIRTIDRCRFKLVRPPLPFSCSISD